MKKLLLLLAIAGCGGGHEVIFLPDASNAPCGLGTWELTSTAGAGDCAQPGTTDQIALEATYSEGAEHIVVVGDASRNVNATTMDDNGHCKLQGTITRTVTGPQGAGTESATVSVTEMDGDVSGFGATTVSGGFTCNQATSFAGTYTPE